MGDALGRGLSGRRILLLAVAGLLSVSALLAIGILLFGSFGRTEGRILGTTALLAGYGLLALPGAILFGQKRLEGLAATVAALAAVGASLALGAIWTSGAPLALGKTIGTVTLFLLAAAQTAALAARRQRRDPVSVRRLFAFSTGLATVDAAFWTALIWSEVGQGFLVRLLAALVVLDVLVVALQPILARARPVTAPVRLRILVEPDETVELTVEAPDLATAAAKAIRSLEREGRRVVRLERDELRDARPTAGPGTRRQTASRRSEILVSARGGSAPIERAETEQHRDAGSGQEPKRQTGHDRVHRDGIAAVRAVQTPRSVL